MKDYCEYGEDKEAKHMKVLVKRQRSCHHKVKEADLNILAGHTEERVCQKLSGNYCLFKGISKETSLHLSQLAVMQWLFSILTKKQLRLSHLFTVCLSPLPGNNDLFFSSTFNRGFKDLYFQASLLSSRDFKEYGDNSDVPSI